MGLYKLQNHVMMEIFLKMTAAIKFVKWNPTIDVVTYQEHYLYVIYKR